MKFELSRINYTIKGNTVKSTLGAMFVYYELVQGFYGPFRKEHF